MTTLVRTRAVKALALAAVGAALAVVAVAIGAGRDARGEPPSLLLITIDTLRHDHLGCTGHSRIETPRLDALAAAGTLFETTIASAPTTAPSHATMLTALSPRAHGILANGQTLNAGIATLAERLRDAGYVTGAIVSSAVLARRTGLDRGFDDYVEAYGSEEDRQNVSPAESTSARAIAWLREKARGSKPFFLWVHYYDPHQPYAAPGAHGRHADPNYAGAMREWNAKQLRDWMRDGSTPPEESRHLRAAYDGEIRYVDAHVGAVLDALEVSGVTERTLVCVTSDHGETLGEHDGYFGHTHHLYDTTLCVPLIIALPGRVAANRIEPRSARLLDLAPTLLDLLDQPPLAGVEGVSLLSSAAARTPPADSARAVAISETHPAERPGPDVTGAPRKLSVRTDAGKLIRWLETDSVEVFDLARDPGETKNLAATLARAGDGRARGEALAIALGGTLDAWTSRFGDAAALDSLDEETRERLRSLGYIE